MVQVLGLKVAFNKSQKIRDWRQEGLIARELVIKQYSCGHTVGAGSICGGTKV
jgi:hypothetical protein